MCCYAGKLLQQPEMNNPTLLVVTDRNDLTASCSKHSPMPRSCLSKHRCRPTTGMNCASCSERESGGIIFTTVQKFSPFEGEDAHPILNSRHNIVVISDEAHRSQYGHKGRFVKVKDKDGNVTGNKLVFGFSQYMRDALPNASFIGFTGTPIALEDKDTRSVFGDYVSIYDIQDAVDDGATVAIYYESRLAKLDLNHAEIERLSIRLKTSWKTKKTRLTARKLREWSRLENWWG